MNARPQSLQDVAQSGVDSLADFGRTFRDWLHSLARFTSRAQVVSAIQAEPARLAARFAAGEVADAWLAASAELLAARIGHAPPEWAFDPTRIAPTPWFSDEAPELRALALLRTPLPFKRRNLFTPEVEVPLRLRAGRPVVSDEQKRRVNAERQRRFRKNRQQELARLRALVRAA